MDGFWFSNAANKAAGKYNYVGAQPAFVRSDLWVPFDQAPPEWQQQVMKTGGRQQGGNWETSGREAPVPGGQGIQPLAQRQGAAPKGQMVSPLNSAGDTGFMGGTREQQGLVNKAKALGGNALSWLGDNGDLAFRIAGGIGDWFEGREEDKDRDEAIQISREEMLRRQGIADKLSGQVGAIKPLMGDSNAVFDDPSSPFYKKRVYPPLGG